MMRPVRILRQVDKLGRLVLPMKIRRQLNIDEGTPLEVFVERERILLRVYEQKCSFCESQLNLKYVHGKYLCEHCLLELHELAKKR